MERKQAERILDEYYFKFGNYPPMFVTGGSYDDKYLSLVRKSIDEGRELSVDDAARSLDHDPLNVYELTY